MPPLKTAVDMFEEMARRGVLAPFNGASRPFAAPSALKRVPTITTYSTPELPIQPGAFDHAGLETGARANSDGANPSD